MVWCSFLQMCWCFFFFFWSGCRFQEFVVGYGWVRVLLLSMMCWFVSSYSFCVMLYRCWFYHGYLGSSLFIHLYLWVGISYNYEIFLWEELRLLLKKIFFLNVIEIGIGEDLFPLVIVVVLSFLSISFCFLTLFGTKVPPKS